jgi:hypothetical protein
MGQESDAQATQDVSEEAQTGETPPVTDAQTNDTGGGISASQSGCASGPRGCAAGEAGDASQAHKADGGKGGKGNTFA